MKSITSTGRKEKVFIFLNKNKDLLIKNVFSSFPDMDCSNH